MHDEVSETENIRNNLAIERIIVGGCGMLPVLPRKFVESAFIAFVHRHSAGRQSGVHSEGQRPSGARC